MKFAVAVFLALCLAYAAVAQDCFIQDFAYVDNILTSGRHNLQNSPEECQTSCLSVSGCTHWTWLPNNNYCELKSGSFGLPLDGAVSGPRVC